MLQALTQEEQSTRLPILGPSPISFISFTSVFGGIDVPGQQLAVEHKLLRVILSIPSIYRQSEAEMESMASRTASNVCHGS